MSTFKASPCEGGQPGPPNYGHKSRRFVLLDARGISCGYACDHCVDWKRAQYRPEIFTNPAYDAPDLGDEG